VTLGGNEMESGVMEGETPIGQVRKWKRAWIRVLLIRVGYRSIVYLQKIIVPAQNKTNDRDTSPEIKGTSK
jgi:hypothetical protein